MHICVCVCVKIIGYAHGASNGQDDINPKKNFF